jgi:hypothetical protein
MSTIGLWLQSSVLQNQRLNRVLFLAFSSIYSITAGAHASLFPTALAEQFRVQNFVIINGLLYMIRGIGTLVGTPVTGSPIHRHSGPSSHPASSFERTSLMVGCLLVGASMAVTWARIEGGARAYWPAEDVVIGEQNHSGSFISQLPCCNALRSGMTTEGRWILIQLRGTESPVCIPTSCRALSWTRCHADLCRSPSCLNRNG